MTNGSTTTDKNAQAAMNSIAEYGMQATPVVYEVWYAYHTESNIDLRRAMDVSISSNREIDAELIINLHERYLSIGKQTEQVTAASAQLELVVNNVMERMQTATDDAGEFGTALQVFHGGLDDNKRTDLHELVAAVMAETRKIEAQNNKMQDELASYSNEVSKLREDLEYVRLEARTDALTGLANRKFFDNFINEAARDSVENSEALTLLIADVDYFKSFNDTYGHQLGDQVLRVVASILRENTKGRDLASRYGGEEFCIVLPDTKLSGGTILANQMRERLATKKIVKKRTGEELRQITMSIGVAEFKYGEPIVDLIGRADQALYLAKQNGRNLVATEIDLSEQTVSDK